MVGKSIPVVTRLIAIADTYWVEIDGEAAARGLPTPLSLRADRFLNLVLAWARARVPTDQKDTWEAMLAAPLPVPKEAQRRATPTSLELEQEMQDFAALYAQVTGGAA